ncbi:MAG: preprotein translocase subunit SecG [Anaerolineae bacterium]|jgi:preprotein translocase subunit SecG|nr:preprotein translocase subunit SecG [Anaerolineae bacterium]
MTFLEVALQIATIIMSVVLVVLILLQVRGQGLGSLIGGEAGAGGRTRRGLERTVFQITIVLSAVFFVICIFSAVASRA